MSLIVLATGNPFKVVEIEPLLTAAGFETKLQTDFFSDEVVEDGLSFFENALKKARFASAKTGLPALADDSGLEIDALNGAPGIYSARYGCDHTGSTTEEKNMLQVLDNLGDLPYSQRKARYTCAAVYVEHADDPVPLMAIAHWYGEILKEPKTASGIGYDPIFWDPKHFRTASQMTLEMKNSISHRAQAVNQVLAQLKQKNL